MMTKLPKRVLDQETVSLRLGHNSDIYVGGCRFHVQTAYFPGNRKVTSQIFDSGRIVDQKEVLVDTRISVTSLGKKLKAIHQEMTSEIEMLFKIKERVNRIKHPLSYTKLGLVFLQKNLFDAAADSFKRAIELDPNSPDAYSYLGLAYLRKNNFQEAEDVLLKGLQLAPQYADCHYYLGLVYIGQKKNVEAIQIFEKALKINHQFFQAILGIVLALLSSLDPDAGKDDSRLPDIGVRIKQVHDRLQYLLESSSVYNNSSQIVNALKYIKKKLFAESVAEIQGLHFEKQREQGCYFENEFYLKFLYGGKSRDDAFVKSYTDKLDTSIREHPGYADLHNNLGIAYLIQCRNLFLKALDEFRTALKINPNFKRAEKNLKLSENDGKGFLILLRALLK